MGAARLQGWVSPSSGSLDQGRRSLVWYRSGSNLVPRPSWTCPPWFGLSPARCLWMWVVCVGRRLRIYGVQCDRCPRSGHCVRSGLAISNSSVVGTRCWGWPSNRGRPVAFSCRDGKKKPANMAGSCFGWGTRIRTLVDGVRVRCPTTRRSPKGPLPWLGSLIELAGLLSSLSAWSTAERDGPCAGRPSCAQPRGHHGSGTRPCAWGDAVLR